jgi:hypothetical protein
MSRHDSWKNISKFILVSCWIHCLKFFVSSWLSCPLVIYKFSVWNIPYLQVNFLGNDDNQHETMLTAAEFIILETIVRCYTTLDLKVLLNKLEVTIASAMLPCWPDCLQYRNMIRCMNPLTCFPFQPDRNVLYRVPSAQETKLYAKLRYGMHGWGGNKLIYYAHCKRVL